MNYVIILQRGLCRSHPSSASFRGDPQAIPNGFSKVARKGHCHMHAYDTVSAARSGTARYLTFYKIRRPHSFLDERTPNQAYYIKPQPIPVAA